MCRRLLRRRGALAGVGGGGPGTRAVGLAGHRFSHCGPACRLLALGGLRRRSLGRHQCAPQNGIGLVKNARLYRPTPACTDAPRPRQQAVRTRCPAALTRGRSSTQLRDSVHARGAGCQPGCRRSATTVVWIPPRTLKRAVRRRKRGCTAAVEVVGDLVGHRLVKSAALAERPDVELQRLQLHAQPIGHVLEFERGEVRLSGARAQAGELGNLHADRVVALGLRVGESFELRCGRLRHIPLHYTIRGRRHGRDGRPQQMRLTKIKLAGFKSFVDPTQINFPSNLTGVVGPNGCGKSNVIDAVRWVMGELSAKHLRGDNMTDVVFNGSAARKPVGSASVELIFDNADGKIGGAYASYSEISLRRQVGRDGSLGVLHQRHALPAQGHHQPVPRHRPRLAQLRHHRAGHDLAHHRREDATTCAPSSRRRPASRATRSGARRPRRASPRRARTSSGCRTCAMRSRSRSATCSARPRPRGATRR